MWNAFKRSTPPVVFNLLIINCLGLMLSSVAPHITYHLGLHPISSSGFMAYQAVTYMFLHSNFTHLLFNMFALWMFGRTLEYELGSKRFLTYYMACGVGAAIIQLAVGLIYPFYITVGASGAIFGILLAFGVLHPNSMIYIWGILPIKAKWFVIIYGALELSMGINNSPTDNVAHFAHLGGMIWGLILLYYWKAKREIFF